MDKVRDWGVQEFKKLMPGGIFPEDELKVMFDNLTKEKEQSITDTLANLLDFTQKDTKKFINEFVGRVRTVNEYQEKAKRVKAQADKATKEAGGTQKAYTKVRGDITKYLHAGRQICYCQASKHNFVNNCVSCGKVVCEQEGQGPCLFCGAWVD